MKNSSGSTALEKALKDVVNRGGFEFKASSSEEITKVPYSGRDTLEVMTLYRQDSVRKSVCRGGKSIGWVCRSIGGYGVEKGKNPFAVYTVKNADEKFDHMGLHGRKEMAVNDFVLRIVKYIELSKTAN